MELKDIKNKLKQCQPYFIEKDLLPTLYFNEEYKEQEYWSFVYAFLRRLTDTSIGIRLGYTSQNIHYIIKRIIKSNESIIINFLHNHNI